MSADLSEFTVTQAHPVVHACYAMTVNEQRVLLACICQIDPRYAMPDGKTYILTVEQARDLFYTEKNAQNVYRDLATAVEKLYERDVKIKMPNGDILQTRFVQSIVWSPDRLQIQVKFADDIKPYLSELKSNFSSYKLKHIVQLTSIYAIRLYGWLVSWASQNQFYKELEIDDIRDKLELENKYQAIGEFKRRVIEPAIRQINANTDFELDVSYKKIKREIRWIQFRFNQKPDAKNAALDAKKQRETRALRNQAAAQKRKETEVVQAAADNAAALLAEFEALPDGTRYTRLSDGSEWVKSGGVLHCAAINTSVAPAQIGRALASGEFVREGELGQPENYQGEFSEETDDLPGYWEEETEEQQEAIAHQIEFMERELKLIALRERGLISEEKFLEMMIGTPPKEFLEAYEAAELPPSETPSK